MRLRTAAIILGLVVPAVAQFQPRTLTLEDALNVARIRGPAILAARDHIGEAQGRLKGASVLLRENPVLEASAGPRDGAGGNRVDADFGISQGFELGGRRRWRIAEALADVERATSASENRARELLRDVATAFWTAVAAGERMRLAVAADEVAGGLLRSMERRYELGDVAALEMNIARTAAARTRAEVRSSEAQLSAALGDLRILLGMSADENVAVDGNLRQHRQYELAPLTAGATDRPDLRALAAELRQAEAEINLGKGFSWPDLGLGFRYERDEGDNVFKGGLSLSLPVFSRGQELRAVGGARATRLRRELEAGRRAVANEVRTGFEVYQRQVLAAEELERAAVPSLDENENLARRSYEEGEISLVELLIIRRDTFETRLLYLDRLFNAALAGVELEARAGVLK